MAAHHLVLDLDAVARVEERMAHKGVVADGLGVRMQGPCLAQGLVCQIDYDYPAGRRQEDSDLKPKGNAVLFADFCNTLVPMAPCLSLQVDEIQVT